LRRDDAGKYSCGRTATGNLTVNRNTFIAVIVAALVSGLGVYFWQQARFRQTLARQAGQPSQDPGRSKIQFVPAEVDLLKIYGANSDATELEVSCYVAVPKNLALSEKLALLARHLSESKFRQLPINVLEIKKAGTKRVAVVELRESPLAGEVSWSRNYFQGSTGGWLTSEILIKTFLQNDYPGEWVDGVEFYYQGKPLTGEYDHIFLSGTIWRQPGNN